MKKTICRYGTEKNKRNQWGHSHGCNWEGDTNKGNVSNKFGQGTLGFLVNTISWKMIMFFDNKPLGGPISLPHGLNYHPTPQTQNRVELVLKKRKVTEFQL